MTVKHLVFPMILLMASSVACKKDAAVSADNSVLLTTGLWKRTGETKNGKDTFIATSNCDKDNTYAFATDGKVAFDEGATKCDASDPQTTTGSWAFTGTDKTKMILTESGFAITVTITQLDASVMKWSYTNPFTNELETQSLGR